MENFIIHDAIRSLYPNVVTIRDNESFDENNNLVSIDMNAVMIEAERLSNIKPVSFEDMLKAQQELINELNTKLQDQQQTINSLINR